MQSTPGHIKSLGWKIIYEKFPWILVTADANGVLRCPKATFHFHDTARKGWYICPRNFSPASTNGCTCSLPTNLKFLFNLVDN